MPTLTADELRKTISRVFEAIGASRDEAAIVADHLVEAEMSGVGSHGIIRVPQYVRAVREGRTVPGAQLTIIRQSAATCALDGGGGFGQVMAMRAMDRAIELARQLGAGMVSLTNCGHTGRIGSYTEYATRQGMAALMFSNAGGHGQWVAPFGGSAGRLSTNPISIAVPTSGEFPLVLDFATSAAPEGRIRAAMVAGKPIPAGWVIRHNGSPTNDPADLYGPPTGALLPFGGHKGFGLAILIDALAGGLSGSGCCTDTAAPHESATDGVVMLAIDPSAFLGRDAFAKQMQALIAHVKSSPALPTVDEVLVPGEPEARLRTKHAREGIPIHEEVWQAVQNTLKDVTGVRP